MKISYSEYLFSNLIKLYDKEFAELEYDLQFERIGGLYEEFEKSVFNKDTKGEYDCIIDYLVDKYSTKIISKVESDLEVEDDENTITFYVDIPQFDTEEWLNVESFKNRQEAIDFAKEKFGCDDNGMVSLVTNA